MRDLFLIPLAIIYLLVVGALFVYGINFFYMSYLAWRGGRLREEVAGGSGPLPLEDEWPMVTVQLPLYNELYVGQRIIEAAARLDYPAERLQIQVLDDSTDETRLIAQAAVERLQGQGVNIVHLVRPDRQGYKAGALQAGLAQAEGEFIAMFDADFMPPPDYLRHTLPHFSPNTAFVQARWGHLNRDYSLLTSLQSIAIDAHFVVEQFARWSGGFWFNFNGTAGIWRRAALEDAGGWTADTLTEDLDISYRALLRGWQARYLRQVEVPAELPVSVNAFRRQQHRWARGSLECALKLGPQVWHAAVPLRVKVAATLHLTGYCVHLLLFSLALLYPGVLLLSQQYPQLITLFGIAYLFNFTALAPTCFFMVGQRQLGRRWWQSLPRILFVTAVGAGLMLNTVRATLQILLRTHNSFERTAKFGLGLAREPWAQKRYQLRLDPIVFWELTFAGLNLCTVLYAISLRNWGIAAYATVFCIGLFFVSGLSLAQALIVRRQQARREAAESLPPLQDTQAGQLHW